MLIKNCCKLQSLSCAVGDLFLLLNSGFSAHCVNSLCQRTWFPFPLQWLDIPTNAAWGRKALLWLTVLGSSPSARGGQGSRSSEQLVISHLQVGGREQWRPALLCSLSVLLQSRQWSTRVGRSACLSINQDTQPHMDTPRDPCPSWFWLCWPPLTPFSPDCPYLQGSLLYSLLWNQGLKCLPVRGKCSICLSVPGLLHIMSSIFIHISTNDNISFLKGNITILTHLLQISLKALFLPYPTNFDKFLLSFSFSSK